MLFHVTLVFPYIDALYTEKKGENQFHARLKRIRHNWTIFLDLDAKNDLLYLFLVRFLLFE